MIPIAKKYKNLLKWLLVVVIIGIIIYTFRDSAGPILEELKKTAPTVLAVICAMAVCYHLLEGLITAMLVKQYRQDFTLKKGITNAFLCSFYRVATLGSGAGIAAIVYLGEQGVAYSHGFGLYMVQYAMHKLSIALFSLLLFLACFPYMSTNFAEYAWYLAAGYMVTAVITVFLLLFVCSMRFHQVILRILEFINRKCRGRFTEPVSMLKEQCMMLEQSSCRLLKNPGIILKTIGLNLVKFCFFYGIPYFTLRSGCEITLPQTMAVTSLSVMLAAVLPSPAGIGSTEVVFTMLSSQIVDIGLAGSAALLYRFGTFVFPFLLGGAIAAIRHIYHKHKE